MLHPTYHLAHCSTEEPVPFEEAADSSVDPFYIIKNDNVLIYRFASFYDAYRFALNCFGDEDFTIWSDDW